MSWLIVGMFYLLVRLEIYLKIALTQFKKAGSQNFFERDKEIFVIFRENPMFASAMQEALHSFFSLRHFLRASPIIYVPNSLFPPEVAHRDNLGAKNEKCDFRFLQVTLGALRT